MFCLRIDLDTAYATPAALENLLPVLKDNDAVASFFIPMGGESNLLEIARTRGKGPKMPSAHHLPKRELLRMALLPRNYAHANQALLKNAISQGNVVGCHGWKHREWTRSLDELDLQNTFLKMVSKYEQLFGRKPLSFAAPGFRWNEEVLRKLDEFGFKTAGDLPGNKPFRPAVGGIVHDKKYKCVQVPVNMRADDTRPLIEWLSLQGKREEEIVRACCKHIAEKEKKHGYACMYAHDFFECKINFPIVKRIVEFVSRQGIEFATVEQAAKAFVK